MYRPPVGYGNYYQDNSEGEEPLVEEFDPNFQPDEEEVRAYAVQKLGMNLPEDNMLLHLAREALKKPLPDSWGAYQSPNGQVYYKHKVTQQKVYDHPIDVEYSRLYQEEKNKIARRTLKSKTSKPAGIAAMKLLGNIAREQEISSHGGSGIGSNMQRQQSYLNQNISGISDHVNESEIERKHDEELRKFEEVLARDYEDFRFREEKNLTERERRIRESHQDELDRINRSSQLPVSFDQRVRQQKDAIRKQFDQEQEQLFKRELRDEQQRLRNEAVRAEKDLEQEWQLKMSDVEERNNQKLESKANLLEKMRDDLQREKLERQERQKSEAKRARDEFDRSRSQYIKDAEHHLQLQLQKLSREREDRLRLRKQELENEYQRIRKLLKNAPEDRLKELIERKSRLQDLNDKKFVSHRAKEMQIIERQFKNKLDTETASLREKLQSQYQLAETQLAARLQDKLRQQTIDRASHIEQQLKLKEKDIFDRFREKLQQYQLNRNKKLISARQNFIEEIEGTKDRLQKEHEVQSTKLLAREKQFELANLDKIIKALREDIKFGERQLKKYQLDRKLYRSQDQTEITQALKAYMAGFKQNQLQSPKKGPAENGHSPLKASKELPSVFKQHQQKLDDLKKNLSYDKLLLGKVLNHLQSTSMLPFYDKQKVLRSDLPTDMQLTKLQAISTGKNELIKKYNTDVRKIRENEKMIGDLEELLKKAEYDEESALLELRRFKSHYEMPELRAELEHSQDLTSQLNKAKTQIKSSKYTPTDPDLLTTKRVQDLFEDHSRFLSNVKQQLNSRLWQIRSMGGYGNHRLY